MKKTYFLAIITFLFGVQLAIAQNVKRPDSYNAEFNLQMQQNSD